jgi:hypothetical protein
MSSEALALHAVLIGQFGGEIDNPRYASNFGFSVEETVRLGELHYRHAEDCAGPSTHRVRSPRSLGKLKLREIVLQAGLPQPHPRI